MIIIKYIATALAGAFLAGVVIWIGKQCVKDTLEEIRKAKVERRENRG